MQAQSTRSDPGGTVAAIGSAIIVIGVLAYFLQMASVDVASWLGDDLPIVLVGLGGILFIGGLLRGSTGGGSDEAA
jgi:hypothetical protein